jgi:hypothetical protein
VPPDDHLQWSVVRQHGSAAACAFVVLLCVPVIASGILLLATFELFADPALLVAIRREQGRPYEVSAWLSALLPLLAVECGLLIRRHSRAP